MHMCLSILQSRQGRISLTLKRLVSTKWPNTLKMWHHLLQEFESLFDHSVYTRSYGLNTLSASPTKWSNTQTIRRQQPTNILSVFDHFVGLALKKLKSIKLPLLVILNKCHHKLISRQCSILLPLESIR